MEEATPVLPPSYSDHYSLGRLATNLKKKKVVQVMVLPVFVGVPIDLGPTRFGYQTAHHKEDRVIVGR